MEKTIRKMVEVAERDENYEIIEWAKEIVDTLARTANCPSNWRDIGEKLAKDYDMTTWVHEEMELWNHE